LKGDVRLELVGTILRLVKLTVTKDATVAKNRR